MINTNAMLPRSSDQINPTRGFTLIELLVVVTIIALLLAILLPSLARVREQGRQVVCLSNLKQILSATGMYMDAHAGVFPIGPAEMVYDIPPTDPVYRSMGSNCMWGGRRGEIHYTANPDEHTRPLTKFIYRHMPTEDTVRLFQCPSDHGTPHWDHPLAQESIYTVCGNSYYMNTHGALETLREASPASPSTRIMYEEGNVYFLFGSPPKYLVDYYQIEQTTPAQQGPGWHGRWSRFNLGFLDLHATNMYIDTRNESGPGWTVSAFPRIWLWRVQ